MKALLTQDNVDLMDILNSWANRAFVYESDNCCEFVGEVLQCLFGKNPMNGFHYKTKKQAREAIREHGSLVGAINKTIGEPVSPGDAFYQGDVVVCRQSDRSWIAGVVLGGRIVVKTQHSIMDWPLSRACFRWRM